MAITGLWKSFRAYLGHKVRHYMHSLFYNELHRLYRVLSKSIQKYNFSNCCMSSPLVEMHLNYIHLSDVFWRKLRGKKKRNKKLTYSHEASIINSTSKGLLYSFSIIFSTVYLLVILSCLSPLRIATYT